MAYTEYETNGPCPEGLGKIPHIFWIFFGGDFLTYFSFFCYIPLVPKQVLIKNFVLRSKEFSLRDGMSWEVYSWVLPGSS
jgi:hypothetical protein